MNRSVLFAVTLSLTGILFMDFMGVMVRILSATYSPSQLAIYRNFFGLFPCLILFLIALRRAPQKFFFAQWKLAAFRGLCVTFAQVCYYLALSQLEFATTSALAFCAPMIITCLAALLLREQVGAWRWGAVVIGFAGIIWVMQPGSDVFTWFALLPVGAAFGFALAIVLVRKIEGDVSTAVLIIYASASATLSAIVVSFIAGDFTPVQSAQDWTLIIAMGLVGGTGVILLVEAYRHTSPAILAPFDYFGIIFAFILGYIFFNEAPFERLFPGVLLIVAGGLIIVWREGRTKKLRSQSDIVQP